MCLKREREIMIDIQRYMYMFDKNKNNKKILIIILLQYINLLIPKVINVYEKRRFIFLFVDDILCT